ncbi:MAG: leucine-rich repeat domain-containing protein [Candidatus Methanomethylophilaceae archaeon]|nr:leucine-rich repeat domain-containing protein [Candidatus Methanomethylophilaceae archaeon]
MNSTCRISPHLLRAAGIVLLIAAALAVLPGAESDAVSGEFGEGLTWSLENGVLTVSGDGTMETPGEEFVAPWSGQKASIVSVVISDGVATIGDKAFYGCANLKAADLGEVSTVGMKAFAKSGLESVDMGESLVAIGQYAFTQTSLTEIVIPYGVKNIGASAFSGLSPSSISIPSTVKTIGSNAFYKMKFLDSDGKTRLPATADDLRGRVFDRTGSSYVSKVVGFSFDAGSLNYTVVNGSPLQAEVSRATRTLASLTVPEEVSCDGKTYKVVAIGDKAFYGCDALKTANLGQISKIGMKAFAKSGLESVDMGESLVAIGQYAFTQTSLTEIVIPHGVKTIGASAFSGLSPSKVDVPTTVKTVGSNAFYKMKFLDSDGKTQLPATADDLRGRVFDRTGSSYVSRLPIGCTFDVGPLSYTVVSGDPLQVEVSGGETALSSLTVTKNVSYQDKSYRVVAIGDKAFYGCADLKTADLGEVVKVGSKAFANSGLKSVDMGGSLKAIGPYAFFRCPLMLVEIPESVESIGISAFSGCASISNLRIASPTTAVGNNAFFGLSFFEKDGETPISYLDAGFPGHRYAGSVRTLTMTSDIEVGNVFEADGLEYRITSTEMCGLKAALIGKADGFSFTDLKIRESAIFEGCSFKVTSIESKAFYKDDALVSVYIPNSVTTVGLKAFAGCESLTRVKMLDGTETLGGYAFYGCGNVTYIRFPATLDSIGTQALKGFIFYDVDGSILPADASSLAGKTLSGTGSALSELTEVSFLFCDNFENDGFVAEVDPETDFETQPETIVPGIWVHGYGVDLESALADACDTLGKDVEFGSDGRISAIGNVTDGNVFLQYWDSDGWTCLNGSGEYLGVHDMDVSDLPDGERFFAVVHGGASYDGQAPEPRLDPDSIYWYFEDLVQHDGYGSEVLFYVGDNFQYSELYAYDSNTDALTLLIEGMWIKGYAEPGDVATQAFINACDAIGYELEVYVKPGELDAWIDEINGITDGNLLHATWSEDLSGWTQDSWLGNTEVRDGLTMCIIHGRWGGGADDPPYPETTPASMAWAY